ncbi:MAG: ABC transporter permease subunit [Aggregatilineales bacterium]
MPGVIFINTLKSNWRGMLGWGIGMLSLGWMIVAVIPNVDALQQYADLVGTLPPAMLSIFGASDVAAIATPEGFIAFGFFTYAVFILCAYGVLTGISITAGEEDSGILDMVLSQPVKRWRIIAERFAAHTIIVIGIALLSFAGIFIGSLFTQLEIDLGLALMGCLNMIPITLFIIAMTAVLAVIVRRKNVAMGIAGAIIIGSYFLNFLGESATDTILADLRAASFFRYFDASTVMSEGLIIGNVAVLLIVAAICFAGTIMMFERRDVGL